jgi:hypothetical protein
MLWKFCAVIAIPALLYGYQFWVLTDEKNGDGINAFLHSSCKIQNIINVMKIMEVSWE